jgi:hypothetical protein
VRYVVAFLLVLTATGCGRSATKDMARCLSGIPDDIGRHPDILNARVLECMEAKGYKFHGRDGCPSTAIACYDTPGKLPANFPFPPN